MMNWKGCRRNRTWTDVGGSTISTFSWADIGNHEYPWSENCLFGNKNQTGHLPNTGVSFIFTLIYSWK